MKPIHGNTSQAESVLSAVAGMCAHCKADSIVRNSQHQQILQALSCPIYRDQTHTQTLFPLQLDKFVVGWIFMQGFRISFDGAESLS